MKIYLVVDSYQYDGGFTVFGAYANADLALIRQQEERKEFVAYCNSRSYHPHNLESMLEAIHIEEVDYIQ